MSINIFEEMNALKFPADQYILVGSANMAVKGIREANDIDIIATPALFKRCMRDGWEVKPWTKPGKTGKQWLRKGIVDMHLEVNYGDANPTAEELLQDAEIINGIPFVPLWRIVEFKREYARPKDFEDIILIENYLKKNPDLRV